MEVTLTRTYSNAEASTEGPYKIHALLAPDGKIKYESVVHPHPIEEITDHLLYFSYTPFDSTKYQRRRISNSFTESNPEERNGKRSSRLESLLKDCGAPPLRIKGGFIQIRDLKGSERDDMREALEELVEWLMENGSSIDISEPMVYYPEDVFDEIEVILKLIERQL